MLAGAEDLCDRGVTGGRHGLWKRTSVGLIIFAVAVVSRSPISIVSAFFFVGHKLFFLSRHVDSVH